MIGLLKDDELRDLKTRRQERKETRRNDNFTGPDAVNNNIWMSKPAQKSFADPENSHTLLLLLFLLCLFLIVLRFHFATHRLEICSQPPGESLSSKWMITGLCWKSKRNNVAALLDSNEPLRGHYLLKEEKQSARSIWIIVLGVSDDRRLPSGPRPTILLILIVFKADDLF